MGSNLLGWGGGRHNRQSSGLSAYKAAGRKKTTSRWNQAISPQQLPTVSPHLSGFVKFERFVVDHFFRISHQRTPLCACRIGDSTTNDSNRTNKWSEPSVFVALDSLWLTEMGDAPSAHEYSQHIPPHQTRFVVVWLWRGER
jgi:hypothetical protein